MSASIWEGHGSHFPARSEDYSKRELLSQTQLPVLRPLSLPARVFYSVLFHIIFLGFRAEEAESFLSASSSAVSDVKEVFIFF